MPIGEYLLPNRSNDKVLGAHIKYRPQDWKPMKCLKLLHDNDSKDPAHKEDILKEVFRNFKPVFHHFFLERFKTPGEWFERRLVYTKSVAINSMVGYILGIGDRHPQNILIDTNTAELVHIDFGIAFEMGKILPHPELIPFREQNFSNFFL